MLFAYNYIPHRIEKLQQFIDYIFLDVWCKANGEYGIEKLDGCPELRDLVWNIYINPQITNDYLYGPIENVYNFFLKLSDEKKDRLSNWYRKNNSIEELCCNQNGFTPVTYKELDVFDKELSTVLNKFFVALFENVIHLSDVKKSLGTSIDEHYDDFTLGNDNELCPFCGLEELYGPYNSKREAYDHFLPKSVYPFNSINFKNLAPMGYKCNSSYKLRQDPLYERPDPLKTKTQQRRKAFYPYTIEKIDIEIGVELLTNDIDNLKPDQIELKLSSPNHQEEVDTWKEIFGIEERYKDQMRKQLKGKYWYTKILNECSNCGFTPEELLSREKEIAEINPLAEVNFLRIPFLEACERKDLFKTK